MLANLNNQIIAVKHDLRLLEEKRKSIYQNYKFFLSDEYVVILESCFNPKVYCQYDFKDKNKHNALILLSQIVGEYATNNSSFDITTFEISDDQENKLYSFISNNGVLYIINEMVNLKTGETIFSTFVQTDRLDELKSRITFVDIQDFVRALLENKTKENDEKIEELVISIKDAGVPLETILERIIRIYKDNGVPTKNVLEALHVTYDTIANEQTRERIEDI